METLPDDVLIDIFRHLDVNSKLKVTRVCKRFNDVISNSMKLMENIQVEMKFYIINRRADVVKRAKISNWNPILSSNRKYQILKITHLDDACFSANGDKILEYLKKFESNWKVIEVAFCRISYNYLIQILNVLKNLREINFVDVNISFNVRPLEKAIGWPNLRCFRCVEGSNSRLYFLNESKKLREISINKWAIVFDQIAFEELLCVQEQLERLEIKINDSSCPKLLSSDIQNQVKFQLKSISLYGIKADDNLLTFLETQKHLEELVFKQCAIANDGSFDRLFSIILNSNNLKSLDLHISDEIVIHNHDIFKKKNFCIENLTLSMENRLQNFHIIVERIVSVMPNIKQLSINKIHSILNSNDIAPLSSLNQLTDLTLKNCKMDAIKTLQVKNLRRLKMQFEFRSQYEKFTGQMIADWIHFLDIHKNVEELKLDYIRPDENLLQLIGNVLQQVKHVELWISNLESIKSIIGNFRSLSSADFRITNSNLRIQVDQKLNSAGFSTEHYYEGLKVKKHHLNVTKFNSVYCYTNVETSTAL